MWSIWLRILHRCGLRTAVEYDQLNRWHEDRARSNHDAVQSMQRDALHRHEAELERVREAIDKIIERAVEIEYRRADSSSHAERYAVCVTFDARLMAGMPRDPMRELAMRISQEIECEIASSKFVMSAAETERREYARRMDKAWAHLHKSAEE